MALAGCGSAASPGSRAPPDSSVAASMIMGASATARCAVTPDASPDATIQIAGLSFGDAVTIIAGQTVAFTNQDGVPHTVTEGTGGQAAADACVDSPIGAGTSLIVIFSQVGDYQITCKIHNTMQTVVHVT